jgi:hypothetical protein
MTQLMPTSSAFFKGQQDALRGVRQPHTPSSEDSFNEHLYYRGYIQQARKIQKATEQFKILAAI